MAVDLIKIGFESCRGAQWLLKRSLLGRLAEEEGEDDCSQAQLVKDRLSNYEALVRGIVDDDDDDRSSSSSSEGVAVCLGLLARIG